MSIWDDIGDAVSSVGGAIGKAVDAVGEAVGEAVNAVGEAVSNVVDKAGRAASRAIKRLGKAVGNLPGGRALKRALDWGADLVSATTGFVAAVIKAVFGIIAGIASGAIRVIGGFVAGLLGGGSKVFVKGLGDIASGIGGGILVIAGAAVGFVQGLFLLQGPSLPLTEGQHAILWRVYRRSVDLEKVRIVRGFAGLFSISSRPFTLGNTIYFKKIDPDAKPDVLVHECGHIWQYQNLGSRYTTDALGAQLMLDDAYDWEAEIARGKLRWRDFNAEAAAEFLEDLYLQGRRSDGSTVGQGVFYNDDPIGTNVAFPFKGIDRTVLARESVAYVRSFVPAFLPKLWPGSDPVG